MVASTPHPPSHKPLHRHMVEGLEHVVDRFGMYMALGVMLIMAAALITIR